MSDTDPHPRPPDLQAQVTRLEESLGYSDRRVDELNEEVAELNKRLNTALRQLAKLEGRIDSMAADTKDHPLNQSDVPDRDD